jgi:mono/diheme cytochrome c family protein
MPSLDAFIAWVRKPGPGQMPVYTAKVLTDADLTLIYAYLSSLHAPTSIPAVLTHP